MLLDPQNLDQMTDILLTETTSLGVRYYAVHRHINYRKVTIVSLPEGEVRIKYAQMDGKIVNIAPEFEDCKVLALKSGHKYLHPPIFSTIVRQIASPDRKSVV